MEWIGSLMDAETQPIEAVTCFVNSTIAKTFP